MKTGIMGKKLRRADQDFYLQITSMIDTLVIILVFMLMTLGSGSINLEMADGVKLPWAVQGGELPQGVKIVAKTDGIYLDQEKIVPLRDSLALPGTTSEEGKKIVPLFERLAVTARESRKQADKSGVKFEGKILLQADKAVPLKTIRQILYSSARAGYNDFRFAVVRQ